MGKSIWGHLHNRQLLLFLIALVLPCSVLIVLTWQLIGQQQELSVKRQADERRRIVQEISRDLLAHLEDIKLHEVSARSSGMKSLNTLDYASPAVLFVGQADGQRLYLPWERNATDQRMLPFASDLSQRIRQAEQEEFIYRRWERADQLYLECIEKTTDPAQATYIQLLRARSLSKSEDRDKSLAVYRDILEIHPNRADEHGIPFNLYAMSPLVKHRDSLEHVLNVIENSLQSTQWLIPKETYMIRDILDEVSASMPDETSLQEGVVHLQETVLHQIEKQNVALALQADFPRLGLIAPGQTALETSRPTWYAYGDAPLLVGIAPALLGEQRLCLVIQCQHLLDTILTQAPYPKPRLVNAAYSDPNDPLGTALGSSFPNLHILLSGDILESSDSYSRLQQSLYWAVLAVVLCVTLSGAYFLWRDVTRELHLASLRSQFIASVSHELKTPLTAIRIFAETLRLGRFQDAQTRSDYLDTIVHESHRLTRLLNNVLDFSKIEKGKRIYHKEIANLENVVQAVTDTMQYPLKEQGFHLDVVVADNLPDMRVDRDAAEQALLNLLSNAMKYSDQSREIGLRVWQEDNHVVMAVTDHGIGIAPSEQSRIFEKFHRVPSPENQRIPGTGLGLALVAHIVEAHGGHINVQSRLGEGSTFAIYLPVENDHATDPGG